MKGFRENLPERKLYFLSEKNLYLLSDKSFYLLSEKSLYFSPEIFSDLATFKSVHGTF